MRIVTWNINSVRLRIDLVLKMAQQLQPDVLCLQETKTPDEFFPVDALTGAGYAHHHFNGMKGYNGVAIFSKLPLDDKQVHKRVGKTDSRHISAKVKRKGGVFELHNIYIPAGGDLPDPAENDKFKHKLDFYDELAKWFPKERSAKDAMVAVGDLNVAPLEHDVWDHKKMLKIVSHTPVEVDALNRLRDSNSWVDLGRHFYPAPARLHTWWSYRSPDWTKNDRGRRLDHMWATADVAATARTHHVFEECRSWLKPSDHVPIMTEFDL